MEMRDPAHHVSSRAIVFWTVRAVPGWLLVMVGQLLWLLVAQDQPGLRFIALAVTVLLAAPHLLVLPPWRYRAHRGEGAGLDVHVLFLGIENLRFVFLQLWRGKALSVDQGLLAFVIGRGQVRVRLRDFEIVAEDGVELYFQAGDSGALAFALFDLGQDLFAVAADIAERIEFLLDSLMNDAAL